MVPVIHRERKCRMRRHVKRVLVFLFYLLLYKDAKLLRL